MNKHLWAFFSLLFIFACNKEAGFIDKKCKNGPPINELDPSQYIPIYPSYSYSSFNPANESEFAFLRRDESTGESHLWKYNFTDYTFQPIFQNGAIYKPKWSINNWIAFTSPDFQIWKIKGDGSNLTQLTEIGKNYAPIWSNSGDTLIFTTILNVDTLDQNYSEWATIRMNNDGVIIDTLEGSMTEAGEVGENNKLIGIFFSGIFTYNFQDNIYESQYSSDCIENKPYGICWINDSEYIFCCENSIYKGDIITNNVQPIYEGLSCRTYHDPIYNKKLDRIFFTRRETVYDENDMEQNFYLQIVSMNLDGKDETLIDFE